MPLSRRPRLHRTIWVTASLALAAAACDGGSDGTDEAGRAGQPTASMTPTTATASRSAPTRPPQDVGPLADERWEGGPAPVGRLLHDDGSTLWTVGTDGGRRALWQHPEAEVREVAAGPDGRRLAMVVDLDPERGSDPSQVLYELATDGSVQVVDVVRDYWSIESPVFLRPPSKIDPAPALYWVRVKNDLEVDKKGRVFSDGMVDTGRGPQQIAIDLRYAEGLWRIYGYPGGQAFLFSLFKRAGSPTRFEILANQDWKGTLHPSLTRWSTYEHRAFTDLVLGATWLSASSYVVAEQVDPEDGTAATLRGFDVGCDRFGGRPVWTGTELALGTAENPTWMLSATPNELLVLLQADADALGDQPGEIPWHRLDVTTGKLAPTSARWAEGAWTTVQPEDPAELEIRPVSECPESGQP